MKNITTTAPAARRTMKDDYSSLKEAAAAVQRIRLSAQRELELVRKMRADAQRYQQETAMKARSEAHQLVLRTRLATQREIEELIRQTGEEIQKLLADIRVIRISAQEELAAVKRFTAQEELAAVSRFTDAAKLSSMSLAIEENFKKPEAKLSESKKSEPKKKKKQLATAK